VAGEVQGGSETPFIFLSKQVSKQVNIICKCAQWSAEAEYEAQKESVYETQIHKVFLL